MKIRGIPDTIRVGPFDMAIRLIHHREAEAEQRWGCFHSVSQAIEIQEDFPTAQKAADTLLHEIGHAIYWTYGINDKDNEERIVSTFATGWVQVYQDNPWLMNWIKRAIGKRAVK